MTRTLAACGLFLSFACGASMRPIPDDVEPVPRTSLIGAKSLGDGGAMIALADAATPHALAAHHDAPLACVDTRHRVLRARQIAPDRWVIARGVIDTVRNERKAQVSVQIDQLGNVNGALLDDVTDSCLAVIGFRAGDVIRTINGLVADWTAWGNIYQSIIKDGNAVVRFERSGHAMTVLYEVRNE